jgi:hypothetical protein
MALLHLAIVSHRRLGSGQPSPATGATRADQVGHWAAPSHRRQEQRPTHGPLVPILVPFVVDEGGCAGPLSVQQEGAELAPTGRRPRQLLEWLALNANRAVSVDTLVEVVWGDDPPAGMRNTLQTYLSQLRRILGDGSIERTPSGYLLNLPAGVVDAEQFERALASARAAGDPARRLELLDEALALWRG